ncbi:Uncharacterised protein [uncultured archaeon]|nr:Uncharacterised protein [uncultured archaeon]
MIKGGIGGGNTITGLKFEERIDLKSVIGRLPGYALRGSEVFFQGKKVAELYRKNDLYKNFLAKRGIDYSKIISKKLLPDDAIFVFKDNLLNIIEMKFQEVAGSVDEKLQTCDFKNKQYCKIMEPLGIKVRYIYVLNDWFRKKEYLDVLAYIQSVNCHYFFHVVPLDFLGLPSHLPKVKDLFGKFKVKLKRPTEEILAETDRELDSKYFK